MKKVLSPITLLWQISYKKVEEQEVELFNISNPTKLNIDREGFTSNWWQPTIIEAGRPCQTMTFSEDTVLQHGGK